MRSGCTAHFPWMERGALAEKSITTAQRQSFQKEHLLLSGTKPEPGGKSHIFLLRSEIIVHVCLRRSAVDVSVRMWLGAVMDASRSRVLSWILKRQMGVEAEWDGSGMQL
ncbi:unnamed protein product [Pleuronectes platessa]|uniref:Uncharacterized protein n=1 Tax=Pleuronectes platessa TaxID=8262 RepID=A0A9N7UW69_PLEPL|nr:unnamed protein product [Pleuronectes platessa]